MSNKTLIGLLTGVLLVILAWNSFYIVSQTERAVLLRFGKVEVADVQPGLQSAPSQPVETAERWRPIRAAPWGPSPAPVQR